MKSETSKRDLKKHESDFDTLELHLNIFYSNALDCNDTLHFIVRRTGTAGAAATLDVGGDFDK